MNNTEAMTDLRAEVEALPVERIAHVNSAYCRDGLGRDAVLALIDKHSPKPAPPAFEVGQRVKHVTLGDTGTVTKDGTTHAGVEWDIPRASRPDTAHGTLKRSWGRERVEQLVPYDPTAELRAWIAEYGAELTEGDDDARAMFDTLLAAVIAEASRG